MPSRSRRNATASSAIALGGIGSACVLWWTFARTEDVAAFVFSIRPGQRVHDLHWWFNRIAAVWIAGIVLAAGMIGIAIAVRRRAAGERDRDAETWWSFAFALPIAVLVFLTVVAIMGRDPFSLDAGIACVAALLAAVVSFWRGRRREVRS